MRTFFRTAKRCRQTLDRSFQTISIPLYVALTTLAISMAAAPAWFADLFGGILPGVVKLCAYLGIACMAVGWMDQVRFRTKRPSLQTGLAAAAAVASLGGVIATILGGGVFTAEIMRVFDVSETWLSRFLGLAAVLFVLALVDEVFVLAFLRAQRRARNVRVERQVPSSAAEEGR